MKIQKDFARQLSELNQQLGTDIAIISQITGQEYEVLQTVCELDVVKPKDQFVTQDTYCNKVLEQSNTVTFNEVGKIRSMVLHPVYTAMQLEAYIGTPLTVDECVVGTLNFSGFDPKKPVFTEEDKAAVEALAEQIQAAIEL